MSSKKMNRQSDSYEVYMDSQSDKNKRIDPDAEAKRHKRRERVRKVKIALLSFIAIGLMIVSAVTAAAIYVSYSKNVFPNVYVDGVFVGGLKKDQISDILEKAGWDIRASEPLTVELIEKSPFTVDRYKSGAVMSIEAAAEAAYSYGHDSNWYANLELYLKNLMTPVDVKSDSVELDRSYIVSQVEDGISRLNVELGSGDYSIDKENSLMIFTKGAGDIHIDTDALTDAISEALMENTVKLNYSNLTQEPKIPDFDALHTELAREPVNAHFSDDNRFTIIEDIDGVEFDPSEAKRLWNAAKVGEQVKIPMKLTYPEVRASDLEAQLFRDVLGERTTYFPNSNDNRINNLILASSKINDYVMYPGDVFSYNDVVGQRTEEAGFLPAGAYSSGEVVEEVGGGVCQVSSTLYNAMLYGYGLTTVARSPHYFPSDYIEKGLDATVSWPTPHFQFRNDRDYPIKIVAVCDVENRALTIRILGTNNDGTFIKLRTTVAGYSNAKYPDLFEGYGAQTFRDVYDAYGNQIDMLAEIYDVYHTHEFVDGYKAREAAAEAMAAGAFPIG